VMVAKIRCIHEGEVAWKALQDESRASQLATGLYTKAEVDAMRTGGFVVCG
jgi:hypothetical protein